MDDLFKALSKIVDSNTKFEIYSSLNQHMVSNSDIILWNKDIAIVESDLYLKLKQIIYKRQCKFYGSDVARTIPFHDFCIALLCTVSYTFNHTTVPRVHTKSFLYGWRLLVALSNTESEDVQKWIKDRLQERSNTGYEMTFGLNYQNSPTHIRKISIGSPISRLCVDGGIISTACSTTKVRSIVYKKKLPIGPILRPVTAMPEGQLDTLRIIHKQLLDGCL